ncbi:6465_t:CDS:2, partial [Acaulospora colombiana]
IYIEFEESGDLGLRRSAASLEGILCDRWILYFKSTGERESPALVGTFRDWGPRVLLGDGPGKT